MPLYREIPPSPHLTAVIECFWIGQSDGGPHRVTPDGLTYLALEPAPFRGGGSFAVVDGREVRV